MKIIDLLNRIANGEIPKTIVYDERYFTYDDKRQNYFAYDDSEIDWKYTVMEYINDEIEIIEDTPKEEKKIPEKIPYQFSLNYIYCNINETAKEEIDKTINHIYDKINEIIDYLKSKGDE